MCAEATTGPIVHASASAARPGPGRRPEPVPAVQHTTLLLGVPRDQQKRAVRGRASSILLDDAIAPCGFQSATHLCRLFRRRKWTDKSPIIDPRSAEIGTANDRLAAAKLAGVFRLQRPKRSLSPAFAALRGNLNSIAAA